MQTSCETRERFVDGTVPAHPSSMSLPAIQLPHPANEEVATALERTADLLEVQHANPHRVRSYRDAAATLRGLEADVAQLFAAEGERGLLALPHVGPSLAAAIAQLLTRGRFALLERLEGEVSPQALFASVPGIGEELARRIVDELHSGSLEELEIAAHDGRLDAVPGFGPRRVRLLRMELAALLSRSPRRRPRVLGGSRPRALVEPSVMELLEVDRIYRERAAAGQLAKIVPRRFNPRNVAWLPILHLDRDGWSFTALYSNTARAHQLGHTRDWVVIHFERDGDEGQCTVVTEHHGADAGLRVVRGRERECAAHYRDHPAPPPKLPVPSLEG
jgi:hypothetical protein